MPELTSRTLTSKMDTLTVRSEFFLLRIDSKKSEGAEPPLSEKLDPQKKKSQPGPWQLNHLRWSITSKLILADSVHMVFSRQRHVVSVQTGRIKPSTKPDAVFSANQPWSGARYISATQPWSGAMYISSCSAPRHSYMISSQLGAYIELKE